jgi:excisionase family DNA binding protein
MMRTHRGLSARAAIDARAVLSVSEAARTLGVSPSTIWRWIEAGKLPAYRIGPKKIRVRKEDLEQMVQPAGDRKGRRAVMEGIKPVSQQEIERRKALVEWILENRERRAIAPLTASDLIHIATEEEQQSYGESR